MRIPLLPICLLISAVLLQGCGGPTEQKMAGFPDIDGAAVLEHTKILSSDEYEGRFPGTKGEELTVQYIADQFEKAGLKPGNTDGTYFQKVPLAGITPGVEGLTFKKGSRIFEPEYKDDYVAWTKQVVESASLKESELVFVGYGVQAPEFQWDDYKGIDLDGKTLVVLVGDPPVSDPNDPDKLDPETFGGRAMTYYGRWTYKYEKGAEMGAAGVLIVHETGPAGYPFSVLQSLVSEQFTMVNSEDNRDRVAVEGWIPVEPARRLFELAGMDYEEMKAQAVSRDFRPIPLGVQASITINNQNRMVDSRNVVGLLEGSDPELKNEVIIYTGHWDHFGIGPEIDGDRIYHGALDNATGIGGMIEIARAMVGLANPPRRSILFMAVTAEEQGLLGSHYYADNPIYPLEKTLAVINMDSLNVHGKTKDVVIVGLGNSELDDFAQQVAAEQGRVIKPDPTPERGSYYRSDHFPFAKRGVPALASRDGLEFVGRPEGYGEKLVNEYLAKHYHKPSDIVRPGWDMSGAVQELQYFWMVGYRVAQADRYPEWKPGTEFKAIRDAQLNK